jgi:hypothetical protein
MRSKKLGVAALVLALLAIAVGVAWLARGRATLAPQDRERTARNGADVSPLDRPGGSDASAPSNTPPETSGAPPTERDKSRTKTEPVAAVPPIPPGTSAALANVTGRVVDVESKPLVGVRVLALFAVDSGVDVALWRRRLPLDVADPAALGVVAARSTETDALGVFTFDACEPGRFRLALRAGRFAPRDFDDLVLPAGGTLDLGDLELELGALYSGWVFDPNGRAIAGARIACVDDFCDPSAPDLSASVAPLAAVTDIHGAFRTRALGFGRSRLIVRAPSDEHLPELALDVSSAGPGETGALRLVLAEPEALGGRVTSRPSDRGVLHVAAVAASIGSPNDMGIDAAIDAERITAACRADYRITALRLDGTFALDGLPSGTTCELRAISPSQRFDDACPWSPSVLATPSRDDEVALRYLADSSLSFELTDARTRARISDLSVTLLGATHLMPGAETPSSRATGVSRLTGVRPTRDDARVTLVFEGNGFRRTVHEEALRSGVDVELGRIAVDLLPTIEVRVLDRASGHAIGGASVSSTERASDDADTTAVGSATTGADGAARVAVSNAASARIAVRAPGYAIAIEPVNGATAASSARTIELERGTLVTVRVIDETGAPVAGARVEHAASAWSPNDARFGDEMDANPDESSGAGRAASADANRGSARAVDPNRARVTSASGLCAFAELAAGRHTFRVQRREKWLEGEWTIATLAGEPAHEIVLVARGFAHLSGFVGEGRLPLAGARVAVMPMHSLQAAETFLNDDRALPPCTATVTDSRGRYEVRNLEPGYYACVFAISGQALRIVRAMRVDSGERRLDLDVDVGTIEGTVRNPDGSPAPGALVCVASRDTLERWAWVRRHRATPEEVASFAADVRLPLDFEHPALRADDQGRFRLRGVPSTGAYTIFASGGVDTAGALDLGAARRARDERNLMIALEPRGSVRVNASASRANERLMLVALHEQTMRVRALRPGLEALLPALEPGAWRVTLLERTGPNRFARVGESREVAIAAGAEETIEFALP